MVHPFERATRNLVFRDGSGDPAADRVAFGSGTGEVDGAPRVAARTAVPRRPGRALAKLWVLASAAACAGRPAPAADPPVAATPVYDAFPHATVWTDAADVPLSTLDGAETTLPFAFTRLSVVGRDSQGIVVRCDRCRPVLDGRVREEDVVGEILPPEVAAWGGLGEFVLALREAAVRRDTSALRPVMSPEFTYAFIGIQTPEYAFRVWRDENYASLDELPSLLDRGVDTHDGRVWSAPPDFVHDPAYHGPRAGFRQREDGRWEWLFLIRGIGSP